MSGKSLRAVKKDQNSDEFYTRLEDIDKELQHYDVRDFQGKVVYANCDHPRESNFVNYFVHQFHALGLKRFIATCYFARESRPGLMLDYCGKGNPVVKELNGDGDFRSPECVNLLQQADIICTNPPFSLIGEFIPLLHKHLKDYLILAPLTCICYNPVYPFVLASQVIPGATFPKRFLSLYKSGGSIAAQWMTTLLHSKYPHPLHLTRRYNPVAYPVYDNYEAIEVAITPHIPIDYPGIMGVPLTYWSCHDPSRFELVGMIGGADYCRSLPFYIHGVHSWRIKHEIFPLLNGNILFRRLFIRRI